MNTVSLPDGTTIDFPDDTSPEKMSEVASGLWKQRTAKPAEAVPTGPPEVSTLPEQSVQLGGGRPAPPAQSFGAKSVWQNVTTPIANLPPEAIAQQLRFNPSQPAIGMALAALPPKLREDIIKGVSEGVAQNVVDPFLSPLGAGTMLAGGAIPKVAQKAMQIGFGVLGGMGVPGTVKRLAQAKTPGEASKELIGLGAETGMAVGGVKGLAEGVAAVLPRTKAALSAVKPTTERPENAEREITQTGGVPTEQRVAPERVAAEQAETGVAQRGGAGQETAQAPNAPEGQARNVLAPASELDALQTIRDAGMPLSDQQQARLSELEKAAAPPPVRPEGEPTRVAAAAATTEPSGPGAAVTAAPPAASVSEATTSQGVKQAPPLPPQAEPQTAPEGGATKGAEAAAAPTGESPQALGIGNVQVAQAVKRKLTVTRGVIGTAVRARPVKQFMDQHFDATDNMANVYARQMANQVKGGGAGVASFKKTGISRIQDEAASAVVAAGFDPTKLPDFLAKAFTGDNVTAQKAIQYAMTHWQEIEPIARRGKAIMDNQIADENGAGINTEYHADYLPGVYDMDLLMGSGRPFVVSSGGGGTATGFKKGKSYPTPFDAIEDGYTPKSLRLSDLVEHRVKVGQKLMNRAAWADSLRAITDPTDGLPVVTSLDHVSRGPGKPGYEAAPMGYTPREIIPGVRIAVHEAYSKLFDALTGTSRMGAPGEAIQHVEGTIKHGLLLFDTFHASRIMQKELFLIKRLGYRKGMTLLEYSDADLNAALRAGDITPEMVYYARINRPRAQLFLREGLNIGRIQEGLYSSFARRIPGVGTFNKWTFEKMTRGAVMQSALIEFERVKKNNPGWADEKVAATVARDLNAYFGNLGRQGVFKSQTALGIARIVGLAPQWVESMIRTEVSGAKQLTVDPLIRKQWAVRSIGAGLGRGLAAYFVGTQILNLITRGQFTFQNEEKGHKLDAWIPDFTGKTAGFFISPFSVPAEITHDLIRYGETEPDMMAAASRIIGNKISPIMRAEEVLRTGRDWDKTKIVGAWERAKAAAWALAPTPIPASALVQMRAGKPTYPGQVQRQLTASMGFKTEPAPTAQTQIRNMARDWMKDNEDPVLRARYERELKQEFGQSDYAPMRTALLKNDLKAAKAEFDKLMETKSAKGIAAAMEPGKPFTHSKELERRFVNTLSLKQLGTYRRAQDERIEMYKRFTEMLQNQ